MGLNYKLRKFFNKQVLGRYRDALFAASQIYPFKKYVNLGGGPEFFGLQWYNFDSAPGKYNPKPFAFAADTRLPIADGALTLAYSSHFLEHVPPVVAERALAEAHRVLKPGGTLVLKLPDGDAALAAWRSNDHRYFEHPSWNCPAFAATWQEKGIADSIDYRAAMVFCGYWNAAYGNYYSGEIALRPGAYHGPPAVDTALLRQILSDNTPAAVARILRQKAIEECADLTFNHQAAWGQGELQDFVTRMGFRVRSSDRGLLCRKYGWIAHIRVAEEISMYLEAKKV